MKRKQTKKSQQKGRWKAIQLVLKNIEWPDQLSMKRQGNCKSTYLWRWVHILYIHLNTNLFKRGEGIEVNSPFLFIKAKLPARTEHHQEKKKMNIIFFFRLLLSNCFNWKIHCDDHSSLSSTTAVQIWIISYTSHHFTPHRRYELNKLTSLPMCGFIAQLVQQRTGIAEVTGSNPVEALTFFFISGFFFPIA